MVAPGLELALALLEVGGLVQRGPADAHPVGDPLDDLVEGNGRVAEETVGGRGVVEQGRRDLRAGEQRLDAEQFAEARGQKIWLFRNAKDPRLFIEFSESPTEMSHRAQASRLPEEIKLEKRLQSIATYAPDAWELWSEVSVWPVAP